MDEFKQHFAAYMIIVSFTKEIKKQVNAGVKELEYALEMFENIKEMERDYIENKIPGLLPKKD